MSKKHAALLALPPPVLTELDNELRKGVATKVLAGRLHEQGYMQDTSAPSLERELRKYRRDTVAIPEAARVTSIVRSPNPETQRQLLKAVDRWDAAAQWVKMIRNAAQRYDDLLEQHKKMPGALLAKIVAGAERDLHRMINDYTRFEMEAGLRRRAPQQHQHIVASQIQVHTVDDAGQLVKALCTWLSGNEERLPHFQVASLENLVTQLKINDALHALRDARAELPPSPEEEQATKRRSAHLLRLMNGEGDEEPETEETEPREQYVLEHVPDPPDESPHRSPLVIPDRVDRVMD